MMIEEPEKCKGCRFVRCKILEYMYQMLGYDPPRLTIDLLERYYANRRTTYVELRKHGVKTPDLVEDLGLESDSTTTTLWQMYHAQRWITRVPIYDRDGSLLPYTLIRPLKKSGLKVGRPMGLYMLGKKAIRYRQKYGSFFEGPICIKDKIAYWSGMNAK